MKKPLYRLLLAFALFLSSHVNAAVVEFNVVLDLHSGSIGDFDGQQVWFDNGISIDPVTVETGDQILLNVDFAAGQALQISDTGSGAQSLLANFDGPVNSGQWSYSTTLTRLEAAGSTIDLPVTHTTTSILLEAPGGPIANFYSALTDDTLAITGFSTLTSYSSGLTSVDFSALSFLFLADEMAIRPVPIPGALWLLGMALAGLLPLHHSRPLRNHS